MSALLLAIACGVCIEDKVAATYDHAVIARAATQGQVVVFAEPRAGIDAARLGKILASRAARTKGIDPASVRTAAAPPSLSFALDPRAGAPAKVLATIRKDARVPGLELALLRVVEPPAK